MGADPGLGRWYRLLLVAGASGQATAFGIRPIISYHVLDVGGDAVAVGLVAAGFSVLPFLAAVPVGRWVDRSGERTAGVAGALLIAGCTAAMVATTEIWQILVANALFGLGHLMILVGQQAVPATRGLGRRERDRVYATYTVSNSVGQMIGPVLVSSLVVTTVTATGAPLRDLAPALWAGVALALFTAVVTACVPQRRAAGEATGTPDPMLSILRRPGMWQAMVAGIGTVVATDLLLVYLPVWADERGAPAFFLGALLALRAATGIAVRLAAGRLVERFGYTRLIAVSSACAALCFVALPLGGPVVAVVAVGVMGGALGLTQPLTLSWVVTLTAPGQHGAAMGLRMSGNRLAQMLVPFGASALVVWGGTAGVFGLIAVLLGTASATAARASDPS
ncbi:MULTISPECIES: MFS transporter [Pseudonocardia]|uniref:MFS transporter n=2 Tax=Pseudonocardia TaxID=1847 RepID=A0ABQ0S390_9PSEU|nr:MULTISPECIES: MFS transporter [Pseudonocardia]OSY35827.1 putative MFS family transporter protein [Pseudonocardia autotrophica]TDN73121.1 putative MFS family arabinose efflux permease [Pseudonocardia autotrophica]BBG03840.1 MFS transporter [Pseudonocardia autotrophica]GEC27361.1 MFS transporter [Pseudonocardia saturnea]